MKIRLSKVAVLYICAFMLATSTLSGAVATALYRQQLREQAVTQEAQRTELSSTLTRLRFEKAQEEATKNTKTLAAKIEKEQKAEKARQAAIAAARRANVPTVPADGGDCAKPNAHSNPSRIDVIVNKQHCIQPLNFAPAVASVSCAGNGTAVISPQAASDFQALCQAAAVAGVPLGVTSSYRSYETQISTYNYWVAQGGAAAADRYSARPGYSEHQTGLSVDFSVAGGAGLEGFTGSPQQRWVLANGYKYGWIQRYTSANSATTGYNAESWHYRYIGRSAASSFVNSGAGSLEAFWGVSGGSIY